jgi:G3E family GTPase
MSNVHTAAPVLAALRDRPAGLYRMKRFARFGVAGHDQKFTLQTVGGFVRFDRSPWGAGEPRRTELVMIGTGVDGDSLVARLNACVEPDAHLLDEQAMLPILRYLDP